MAVSERNGFVDIMRGVAMLLVVLGHTMTGSTTGAEESFVFNIVWSLQMPLFILISGYVTRYSREIDNKSALWNYIKRRTLAYMLPWLVWSLLIRGVVFGQHDYLNLKWLLWHMDSGYWFLATIWSISVVFGISAFLAEKTAKSSQLKQQIFTMIFYIWGMAALAGIGLVAGLTFFSIKLTLYYMPFFFAGYLYGQYRDRIMGTNFGRTIVDGIVAICLAVWLSIISRTYLFSLSDNISEIVLRALSSITGCVAICGLCKGLTQIGKKQSGGGTAFLSWSGVHSLEIYLSHYLLLNLVKQTSPPMVASVQGLAIILVNYLLTLILTVFTVKALRTNYLMRLVLFGNKG